MKINASSEYRTSSLEDRIRKACESFLTRRGWEIEDTPTIDDPHALVDIVAKQKEENGEYTYGLFWITASYKAEGFYDNAVSREDAESFMIQYCLDNPIDVNSMFTMNSLSVNICSDNQALLRAHYNCFN